MGNFFTRADTKEMDQTLATLRASEIKQQSRSLLQSFYEFWALGLNADNAR